MRLFWILVAFMLGVTAAAIDTAEATSYSNILINGDFETWSGGGAAAPDNWGLSGAGAAIAQTADHKSGTFGALLTFGAAEAVLYQVIPDHASYAGKTITLGMWVKSASGDANIRITDGVTEALSSNHAGDGVWRFMTVTYTVSGAPATLQVQARKQSAGTAYFDGAIFVLAGDIYYSVDNSTMSLPFAYRCQDVVINTNITGGGITAVTAFVNSSSAVQVSGVATTASESVVLSLVSGTHWQGTLGDDANRLRGLRDVSYRVTQNENVTEQPPNATLLFFPDTCTGTGSNFSTQVTCPMGTYLCRMWTGEENFLEMSIHPWTDQWGYIFYFIVLCIIVMVVYMKNQQVQQPLIIALIGLALMATTTAIPDSYKQPIVMLLGISLGALFYRLYIKRS